MFKAVFWCGTETPFIINTDTVHQIFVSNNNGTRVLLSCYIYVVLTMALNNRNIQEMVKLTSQIWLGNIATS